MFTLAQIARSKAPSSQHAYLVAAVHTYGTCFQAHSSIVRLALLALLAPVLDIPQGRAYCVKCKLYTKQGMHTELTHHQNSPACLLQLRGMGHLQLPLTLSGICWRPRCSGSQDERVHSGAIMQLHDLLPTPADGQWPLCTSVQARSVAVCAAQAHPGYHHPSAVHSRQIH